MSNWSREKKKKDLEEFDLAKFISEDRCVVCGNSKSFDNVPEESPDSYSDPPEYPVVTVAKDFIFIVCAECRIKISDGLCITCCHEKEVKSGNTDYVILEIAQHLAEEIIRLRSELTKWIPEIQKYKKAMGIVTPRKDVKKLFRRRVIKNDEKTKPSQ